MSRLVQRHPPPSLRRRASSAAAFTVENVRAAANRLETLLWDDVPEWLQENPYIKSGYRRPQNSTISCLRSCAIMHNETLNIYTHLLPAVALIILQIYIQSKMTQFLPAATMLDRIVISANVLAAIVTFALSSAYHTLISHSPEVSSMWLRIDYVGILTLILGSFFSGIYVGFYCLPTPRTIYWSMIVLFSFATAMLVLHPRLQSHKYRGLKTYAFVATALTGFAPIGHGLFLYGWNEMMERSGMPYYFLEGIIYGVGAVVFITRFPESFWPGYFDIWWSSHTIWHLLVVIGAVTHMYGVWQAFAWNHENLGSCSISLPLY